MYEIVKKSELSKTKKKIYKETYNENAVPLLGTLETMIETKKRMIPATIHVLKGNFWRVLWRWNLAS